MDSRLKKIQVTPAKFDEDGLIEKDEVALLTFEVDLDSAGQRAEVIELFSFLSTEYVSLEVVAKQVKMQFEEEVAD